jgi:hypothetical protein
MTERSVVHIKDRRTGRLVEATLIDGITSGDVELAEGQWQPYIEEQLARMQAESTPKEQWPQHVHWNWREKQKAVEGILAYRMFGIECASEMQGLMLLVTAGKTCRIESQKGKPLVYVHFLAAAPWNLPSITSEPRFSLVGTVFIAVAIQLSLEEEFSGRIGLHSLPQADAWYEKACGMTNLGVDPSAQNLKYFEMTPEQASEFLK